MYRLDPRLSQFCLRHEWGDGGLYMHSRCTKSCEQRLEPKQLLIYFLENCETIANTKEIKVNKKDEKEYNISPFGHYIVRGC
jgi:hypothetical protein